MYLTYLYQYSKKLALTKIIEKNTDIIMAFRSWELIEYPELTKTKCHNWPVMTTSGFSSPRHISVAFSKDISKFIYFKLRNIKVFLNSDKYPYNDLYLDFSKNKYATLYEMFSNFQKSYYCRNPEPIFSPKEFKENAPITYIDCSHQKDSIEAGPVVIRAKFEFDEDLQEDLTAYCLVLHDKIFSYNPLTKNVRQL